MKNIIKKYEDLFRESFGIEVNNLTAVIKEVDYKETFKTEKELLNFLIEQVEMGVDNLWEEELKELKGALNNVYN